MAIYVDSATVPFVWARRNTSNTLVFEVDKAVESYPYLDMIQVCSMALLVLLLAEDVVEYRTVYI